MKRADVQKKIDEIKNGLSVEQIRQAISEWLNVVGASDLDKKQIPNDIESYL